MYQVFSKVPASTLVKSSHTWWILPEKSVRIRIYSLKQEMFMSCTSLRGIIKSDRVLSLIDFLLSQQGLILREEGKHQEALKSFQRTIEFDSKNANNYKEIGKTLFVFVASLLSSSAYKFLIRAMFS